MTLSFKHLFQSAKSDAADTSLVRPSNWNAEHDVELTGPGLVGRTAASQGAAAEIALSGALGIASDTLKVFVPGYTNADIVESHAASAATFALKTIAGADASAADPITAYFGDGTTATLTAALSVTIPSTALMGTRDNIPFRLWFVLINDGGTFRLGVRNCVTTAAGGGTGSVVTAISGFSDHGTLSSTAMTTGSDSSIVTYTDSAVTTEPYVVLGYADYDSGLATAGTWAVSPSRIVLFGPGVPLPGDSVQKLRTQNTGFATGNVVIPLDNTAPASSEGTSFFSQAITPLSAQNILRIYFASEFSCAAPDVNVSFALFQTTTCISAYSYYPATVQNAEKMTTLEHMRLTGTNSSVTFSLRAGPSAAATITLRGNNGGDFFNSLVESVFDVTELMG